MIEGAVSREAFDESVNELLLGRSHRFPMNEYFRPFLCEVASLGMQALQLHCRAGRRPQNSTNRTIVQVHFGQHLTIKSQLARWKRHERPLNRALCPLMRALTA
jgi:hypothetical protein